MSVTNREDRDRGLRLVSGVTRGVLAGAVALSAALGAVIAAAQASRGATHTSSTVTTLRSFG